jgi:hypothetical protein
MEQIIPLLDQENNKETPTPEEEQTVKNLLLEAKKDYMTNKSKVRGAFSSKYFKILAEYYKRTNNPKKSQECLTCSEYVTLLSSGELREPENRMRWKELLPKMKRDKGELSETYKARENFEQAVRSATPIEGSPFSSQAPKGFTNGVTPLY